MTKKDNGNGLPQEKHKVCNFEKHIDVIAKMIRDGGGCINCPVLKDGCKTWGETCTEAFKLWALADSNPMSIAVTKLVQNSRRIAQDNMRDMLQHKKMIG